MKKKILSLAVCAFATLMIFTVSLPSAQAAQNYSTCGSSNLGSIVSLQQNSDLSSYQTLFSNLKCGSNTQDYTANLSKVLSKKCNFNFFSKYGIDINSLLNMVGKSCQPATPVKEPADPDSSCPDNNCEQPNDDATCPDGNCEQPSDDATCPDGNCEQPSDNATCPDGNCPSDNSGQTDNSGNNGSPNNSQNSLTASEQQMVNLVNAERKAAGLDALKVNMELTLMARDKSQDMINKNYFDHNSPTYGSPFDMMKAYGITYRAAGENIAMNSSVSNAHTALMNSPGHRANILNSSYSEIGIGIVQNSSGYYYISQEFIG